MNWIKKIVEVEPYVITCEWNDGKIRKIDLTEFIKEKSKNPENSYAQLYEKDRFAQLKCDGSTLYWEDGPEFEDYDGQIKTGPLDIDPEVLFTFTEDGKNAENVEITASTRTRYK